MTRRARVWLAGIALAGLALVSVCPLPVGNEHRDVAVRRSLAALVSGRPIFLDGKYRSFYDLNHFSASTQRLRYRNDADVSPIVFEDFGLLPLGSEGTEPTNEEWYSKNALVEVTYVDPSTNAATGNLHFNFQYGWLGGQFYRVYIVRNLWGLFVVYRCVGSS